MSSFGSPAPGQGEQVEAVVKWFNITKGFGFVAPLDGSQDAFMHMSVLTRAGLQQVAEGTKLLVTIGQGPKGRQVVEILQTLGMGEIPGGGGGGGGGSRGGGRGGMGGGMGGGGMTGVEESMNGTVKWFKGDKGFGFVTPDDGGKDVFVHKSVVLRAGLQQLDPGQRLRMMVNTASKGREAVSIEPLSE